MSQSDALKQRESTDEKPAGPNNTLVIGLAASLAVILVASLVRSITSGGGGAPIVEDLEYQEPIDTRQRAPLQSFLSETLSGSQQPDQTPPTPREQPQAGLATTFVPPVRESARADSDYVLMALQGDINGNVVIETLDAFNPAFDATAPGMGAVPRETRTEVSSRAADLQSTIAQLEELNRRAAAPGYDQNAAISDLNNLRGAVPTAAPSPERTPTSRLLAPGVVIQSVLSNEINSDVPASFSALVKYPVYDSARQNILIPTGSRLVGRVGTSRMTNEIIQQRVTLQVQSIILPNDTLINIEAAGLDAAGAGGVSGRTDSHFWARTTGTFGYAILGVAPSLTITNGDPQSAVDQATGQFLQQFSENFIPLASQYASLVPTRIIPPGTAVNVVIEVPVYVEPYSPVRPRIDFGGAL